MAKNDDLKVLPSSGTHGEASELGEEAVEKTTHQGPGWRANLLVSAHARVFERDDLGRKSYWSSDEGSARNFGFLQAASGQQVALYRTVVRMTHVLDLRRHDLWEYLYAKTGVDESVRSRSVSGNKLIESSPGEIADAGFDWVVLPFLPSVDRHAVRLGGKDEWIRTAAADTPAAEVDTWAQA